MAELMLLKSSLSVLLYSFHPRVLVSSSDYQVQDYQYSHEQSDQVTYGECWELFNPLPLVFKALLHEQKDYGFFFSGSHLIYIQQESFRAFRPAGEIYIPSALER
jgi:hypothetical protein